MGRWYDTATIQRAGQATNPHTGESEGELSWADEDRTDTAVSCSIQPRQSTEGDRDEIVVGQWVGYFPPDTDLTPADRIAWRGRVLEVVGDVAPWVRGTVHHYEVPLQEAGS